MRRDPLSGRAVGPYRILELLSEDALGPVYLAEHPRLGARVEVKLLPGEPAVPRDAVERFFREVRAVNAIQHERIVGVVDLGTLDDGRGFLVMEHAGGATLSSVLERHGQLPLGALARIAGDVLEAVAVAHDQGIVHGELAPEHIAVTDGRAKVTGFGIGALLPRADGRTRRSRQRLAARASRYRAPEQACGEGGARSDLYAIGAILFEGATGEPPFDGATISELRRRKAEAAPPARSVRAGVPPSLEAVIQRALERDPEDRFASVREMAAALADAARELPLDEPWVVRPLPPAVLRGRTGEQTGPPWLALIATVAIAAAATLAVLTLATG